MSPISSAYPHLLASADEAYILAMGGCIMHQGLARTACHEDTGPVPQVIGKAIIIIEAHRLLEGHALLVT